MSEGGGQHFSKMSEIQKCPKGRRGGGSTPIRTLSQIFSIFYFDASPKVWYVGYSKEKKWTAHPNPILPIQPNIYIAMP